MKKIFGVLVLGFTLLMLGACSSLNTAQFSLDSDEEVLSFSAISTSSLLINQMEADALLSNDNQNVLLSQSFGYMSEGETTDPLNEGDPVDEVDPVETSVENAEKFLNLIELFASGKSALLVETEVSDDVLYENMLTFSTIDMLGETVTYTLYYNEKILTDDDNDDTDDVEEQDEADDIDDAEEQDEEDEKEYAIEGILVYKDQTFEVYGEKEIEDDEQEMKFTAFIDENNYVTSKYELESDESKFYIEEVKDGVLYSETEIKIETEDDEQKIELKYILSEDEYDYEFKFEVEDQRPAIKVEYETYIDGISDDGEMLIYIVLDEVTGETTYEIAVDEDKDGNDDHTYEKDRDDDDDDDEDDEDDEDDDDEDDLED
ncbi:MAG: hypothetical protein WC219_04210 [Acholeplasmataceae bacterium]